MRIPSRSRSGGLKFNLTPMIDVVFNLIIFFLAASHLARSEILEDVQLPEASTGQQEVAELQRRLTITLPARGLPIVGSEPYTLTELEQLIQTRAQATSKPADGSAPQELEVRIRTDRNVPYGQIEPLLLACAKAGVHKVRFAVLPSVPE